MKVVKHAFVCNRCEKEIDALESNPPDDWMTIQKFNLFHSMGKGIFIHLCGDCYTVISTIIENELSHGFEPGKI